MRTHRRSLLNQDRMTLIERINNMIEDARDTIAAVKVGSDWRDKRRVQLCACGAPTLRERCPKCEREAKAVEKNGEL